MARAKPVPYSDAIVAQILERVARGESISRITKDSGMPSHAGWYKWLAEKPELVDKYARAREESADALAEQILEIADDEDLKPDDKRVRIDARKWVASKLKPKKYGDKVDLTHGGEVGVQVFEIAGAKVVFGGQGNSTLPGDA